MTPAPGNVLSVCSTPRASTARDVRSGSLGTQCSKTVKSVYVMTWVQTPRVGHVISTQGSVRASRTSSGSIVTAAISIIGTSRAGRAVTGVTVTLWVQSLHSVMSLMVSVAVLRDEVVAHAASVKTTIGETHRSSAYLVNVTGRAQPHSSVTAALAGVSALKESTEINVIGVHEARLGSYRTVNHAGSALTAGIELLGTLETRHVLCGTE